MVESKKVVSCTDIHICLYMIITIYRARYMSYLNLFLALVRLNFTLNAVFIVYTDVLKCLCIYLKLSKSFYM